MMVEAGDRVRIKNHSKKFNGELGTVDSRDGAYVYVFPDCQPDNKEFPIELYDHEVEKIPMTREEFAAKLDKQQEDIDVVRISSMWITKEAYENVRKELRTVAMLVSAGMEDQMTPCQTLAFEILTNSDLTVD